MTALYECLDEGKVGIFESPTGTGKSLSLICGSLTWLRDYKRRLFEADLPQGGDDDDEPDWIIEHERKVRKRDALLRREALQARLRRVREQEERLKKSQSQVHQLKRKVQLLPAMRSVADLTERQAESHAVGL